METVTISKAEYDALKANCDVLKADRDALKAYNTRLENRITYLLEQMRLASHR